MTSDNGNLPGQPFAPYQALFSVNSFDLDTTLASGQAFRWRKHASWWSGVIDQHAVRLSTSPDGLIAQTSNRVADWAWLIRYLRLDDDFAAVIRSFPDDEPMQSALAACRGLRLLRQPAWECLVGFICSSTKQIVQIEQCLDLLSKGYGQPLTPFPDEPPQMTFPTPTAFIAAGESGLRACKLGFRAPYVLAAAQAVADGTIDLSALDSLPTPAARAALTRLPGVGPKIADCVLLFAYGRQDAFPLDVWMLRGLAALYFPRQKPHLKRLRHFADTHFGPWAGYAQQYIFHYVRRHRPDLGARQLKSTPKLQPARSPAP